tara:strand:- start:58 stop:1581 length:1524 start_codon:yes stop_codon:yes gene_type:complete
MLSPKNTRQALYWVIFLGLLVRISSATFGFGFHARDDYFHVLDPAIHWLEDPDFNWEKSDLAGAGLRSHLIPRTVMHLLKLEVALGIEDPTIQLGLIFVLLGLYALLAVPGMFLLVRQMADEKTGLIAALIAALHFSLPYGGTKLLIEAIAIPPLIFGFYFVARKDAKGYFLGGLLLGFACWLRFQIGVACLGLVAAIVYTHLKERNDGQGKEFGLLAKNLSLLAFGAGLTLLMQGLYDIYTTGVFYGPLINNIKFNMSPPKALTSSSPFSYLIMWLALLLPPFAFVIFPPFLRAVRLYPLLSFPWLVFLISHSFISHKEERFMYPVIPLFCALLALSVFVKDDCQHPYWLKVKKWWDLSIKGFIFVHLLALGLVCINQSQLNQRQAMSKLWADTQATGLLSIGPEIQSYFLQRKELNIIRRGKPHLEWLQAAMSATRNKKVSINRAISYKVEHETVAAHLEAVKLDCQVKEELRGWWLDRLIFKGNPRHNRRRSTIELWHCQDSML